MACMQLTVFVSVKVMTMTILMSVILFLSITTGFGMEQTGVCRPFCTGSDCITIDQDKVDFQTAEKACRDRNGELMTFWSKTDERTLESLSQELYGNFWIGLRLPTSACSNLSAPLRGYEWTSGHVHNSFIPSFGTWKDSVKVCSPHCVSLSNGQKWTERLCSDKTDGFLCKTKHKDACQARELSDLTVIKSSKGCKGGPCEHICTDVKGGHVCSCLSGYIPDSKNPEECKLHCAQHKCPAKCKGSPSDCYCPDGFLLSDTFCEDIDECLSDGCDQECKNTFGSFVCSCGKGFVLKNEVKCIKAEGSESLAVTTPIVIAFVKPATNNHTLKGSSVPAGGFLWMWIFLVVAVVVFIFVIRFYVVKRQKRREQNSNQPSTAPVENIEC